jgi:type II secretory pathway component PulJ
MRAHLLALACLFAPALAQAAPCTDDGRSCLLETALTYVEALHKANPDLARLAPDAVRYRHNDKVRQTRDEIRASIARETMTGPRNIRSWVDEAAREVFVFWTLGVQQDPALTSQVAVRVKVGQGLIREIEAFIVRDGRPLDDAIGWPEKAR